MMPSAEVNSVIIRPHPPRLRMKRRKTVSVMPAMGARTVAGRISTVPRVTDAGTRTPGGATRSAGLSKNLGTDSIVTACGAGLRPRWDRLQQARQHFLRGDRALA